LKEALIGEEPRARFVQLRKEAAVDGALEIGDAGGAAGAGAWPMMRSTVRAWRKRQVWKASSRSTSSSASS
jgi:hypothetical protein